MADKEFKVRIFCSPNSKQPIRNKHRPFFDILAWTFSSGQIELNSECINPGESQIGMVSFVAPELLEEITDVTQSIFSITILMSHFLVILFF